MLEIMLKSGSWFFWLMQFGVGFNVDLDRKMVLSMEYSGSDLCGIVGNVAVVFVKAQKTMFGAMPAMLLNSKGLGAYLSYIG